MKKLTVILMILFVGIILAGCTSQTTTPATTATTAVPTAEPTTVAPTATPTEVVVVVVENTTVPTTATPTPTPTPIPDQKIEITRQLTFSPSHITIPVGTKVTWWTAASGYKFKINAQTASVNINSDIITPEKSWSYTFTKTGTYTVQELVYPQFRDDDIKITVA